MKIKVADYIADILADNGVTDVFSVVGGGAMHLNDAFGHSDKLHCLYNHHEQACAMAAESYARYNNKIAVVCVTTGPGGTNTVTGVLCAWQDSIPVLFISGQTRYATTVDSTGLDLRQFGEQEHYIIKTVSDITKYSVTVTDPLSIRYHIEKALYLAQTGRRGPCWIDIPLDIQGAYVEIEDMLKFDIPNKTRVQFDMNYFSELLNGSKRPVIVAGAAIRTAEVHNEFIECISKMRAPILAANGNPDLLPIDYPMYYGNFGVIGGRAGNFIIQNADCILILGSRMTFKQIGFNYTDFSPNSKKIVVDIDSNELKKGLLHIDLAINMDIKDFLGIVLQNSITFENMDSKWIGYCDELKKRYPIILEKYSVSDNVNPYYFANRLMSAAKEDAIIVVGNSCACDCVRQVGIREMSQRLWGNTNCGTMGYDLPAAIGAAVASSKSVICVTGDGSIQMNIQELQTIVHNRLPIKIIIHSNAGYYAIVQTHTNFFGRLTGCTNATGISFPSFEKIATAYGFSFCKVTNHKELDEMLPVFLSEAGYGIMEVIQDENQPIEPKIQSKVLDNGQIISPAIDDLAPFLDEVEYIKYSNYNNFIEEE